MRMTPDEEKQGKLLYNVQVVLIHIRVESSGNVNKIADLRNCYILEDTTNKYKSIILKYLRKNKLIEKKIKNAPSYLVRITELGKVYRMKD